jgi:tRNA A-37 threonylcarbamoyl transferase component Bud32
LPVTDWDTIIASPHYAGKRLFPVALDGANYWIKRAHRGHASELRNEVRAMAAVARRGVLVPTVVHATDVYIVMTDLGETLQRHLERADAQERQRCALLAADALRGLHAHAGWHGNAALRNLMFSNGRIGMIDFESAAHRWLTLNGCQAFDAWQAIHSLAQFDERDTLIRAFLERYRPSPQVRRLLRLMAWALSPAYLLLVPFTDYLKRDFRQGVYGLRALLALR